MTTMMMHPDPLPLDLQRLQGKGAAVAVLVQAQVRMQVRVQEWARSARPAPQLQHRQQTLPVVASLQMRTMMQKPPLAPVRM